MDRKQLITIGAVGFLCVAVIAMITRDTTVHVTPTHDAISDQMNERTLSHDSSVTVDGYELLVAIADTPSKKSTGLGGIKQLDNSEGMLFPYEDSVLAPAFWMKGMIIPIDIIWINDGQIVWIHRNVPPEPNVPDMHLRHYRPDTPIDYVLEVKGGLSDEKGFEIGDPVVIWLAEQ